MQLRPLFVLTLTGLLSFAGACRDSGGGTNRDTGPGADAGRDAGPLPDSGPLPDGGPRDGGDVMTACNNPPLVPPANGTCALTAGTNQALLIRGNLVVPSGLLENGELLIGGDGTIICADCDCSASAEANGAAELACANGVISPALINAHDHITFTEAPPAPHTERYEHRHDWRRGQNGHTRIPSVSNVGEDHGIWWGEVRNIMAGTTAINGSGGAAGLVRNLDQPAALQDGLNQPRVRYSTFPLRDTGGTRLESGCNYGTLDSPDDSAIRDAIAYAPHIAEGIDLTARNEFLCLSRDTPGSPDTDVILNKTAVIHGIGLLAADFATMAADRASLIWSPRSNIDLYGNTAQVVLAANSGVRIAIGTDWAISGSMNMLRELRCASELNQRNYGSFFTDRQLLDMATVHAAGALGFGDQLGSLAPGRVADVAIWNGATNKGYRAILSAQPQDVVLVLRAGDAMYGDDALMSGLPDTRTECETMDVCGTQKLLCAERETGATTMNMRLGTAQNSAIAANAYGLFFCGDPPDEPSCVPFRPGNDGYMGMSTPTDRDGDGVMDTLDNCPDVFNPVRPLDVDEQADGDDDGDGDACDVCPLQAGATMCAPPNPNDLDGDMVEDAMDNCPNDANMDQADRDGDMRGDVCDPCPDVANPGAAGCPATIYQVKRSEVNGRVTVENALVTAVARAGWFMQTVPGDASYDPMLGERFSGTFVYVGSAAMKPAMGDRVDVTGAANEFFGERQIDASTAQNGSFTVRSSGNTLPAPIVVEPAEIATDPMSGTHGPRAEELEGVLVEVRDVVVTSIDPPRGTETADPINEFVVDDLLRVNDYIFLVAPFPIVGDMLGYVRGIHHYNFDNYKIEPRDALDVGTRERLAALEPMEGFVAAGTNGVPAGGLAVVMNRPVSGDLTVTLASSSTRTTVPPSVIVAAGQQRADVPLVVAADETGTVTITATYDGASVFAELTVYDDAAPRTIVAFTLAQSTIGTGAGTTGSVTLDFPGRAGGSTVTLSVDPMGLATPSPATIIVPAGAIDATFTLTAGTSTGAGTLTATVDGNPSVKMFNVVMITSRPPMPGDLVITEIMRNPDGANEKEREWFEVYNPTTADIELAGLTIGDLVRSYTVPANGPAIPAGGYGVFAYYADPARNGGIQNVTVEYASQDIALNNADETITLTYGGMTIDAISYTGSWPGSAQNTALCLRAPYPADNSMSAAWSNAATPYGTGALGSPGVANDSTNCP